MKLSKYLITVAALPFLFGFSNIAHRGDNENGRYAEHSYQAYDRALAEQANYLELDVHKTADGVLVVSHDPNMGRLFGVDLDIAKTKYATLRQYRNQAGEPIHSLAEVFARYSKDPNIKFMIETKNVGSATGMEQQLVNLVKQYNLQNRVLFESFSQASLTELKKIAPNIPTTLLGGNYQSIGNNDYWASGYYSNTAGQYLKQNGKKYLVWGIDDANTMRNIINSGNVEGILTNYPDRLSQVLGVKNYTPKNIAGKILIKYKNGWQVNVWNGYGKHAKFSGQRIKSGTWVNASQVAIENGKTWYNIGNNHWVDGSYVANYGYNKNDSSAPRQLHGVVQINYRRNGSVNVWASPNATHFTGKRLKNGTRWKFQAVASHNGHIFYNLGGNQWVDGNYAKRTK